MVLRWLLGYGAGLLGNQIYVVTLACAATQVASPARVGLILAAGAIPRALLLLIGGAAADRYGPKRVALVSDAVRVLVVAVITVAAITDTAAVPILVILAVAYGILDALFIPAAGALVPHLVQPSEAASVQSTRSLLQRTALVLGPPAAGFLLAEYGYGAAFGATIALFIVSVGALWFVELRQVEPSNDDRPRAGLLADVADGLRYVRRHAVLAPMLVVVAVAEIATAGPVTTGVPLLADAHDWGSQGVGLLLASFGAGAMATTLAIVIAGRIPHAGRVALGSMLVMGPALAMVGLAESLLGSMVAAVVTGICGGVCSTLIGTFVLTATDRQQLGRVVGLLSLATFGGAPIAYALTGLLADLINPNATFLISGGAVFVIALAAVLIPALRQAELPPIQRNQP
ncbi:MFS transporter [Microbacteriaceae bacterium VKM Ac-2855]|nr:MFS transporter [Microbacteriaceae bacterium VKM Ac-2855]